MWPVRGQAQRCSISPSPTSRRARRPGDDPQTNPRRRPSARLAIPCVMRPSLSEPTGTHPRLSPHHGSRMVSARIARSGLAVTSTTYRRLPPGESRLVMSETSSPDPSSSGVDGLRSASMIRDRRLAHLAGALGIVGQLASAYWYLLYPLLVVPTASCYLFYTACSLRPANVSWSRDHPIRSFFVPVVSVSTIVFTLSIGTTFLSWAP